MGERVHEFARLLESIPLEPERKDERWQAMRTSTGDVLLNRFSASANAFPQYSEIAQDFYFHQIFIRHEPDRSELDSVSPFWRADNKPLAHRQEVQIDSQIWISRRTFSYPTDRQNCRRSTDPNPQELYPIQD
jgi:hypothetical protein